MNIKIEGGRPVFYGEPVKVNYTDVTGGEDMTVNGQTVKRATGNRTEYTLSADEMNAIGWTIDGSVHQPHWKQLENVKDTFFRGAGYSGKISEDIQSMKSSMESLADGFFDGEVTESELADKFQALAEKFIGICKEKQYPFPMLTGMDEAAMSFAYDCFRGAILKSAVQHNNAEGKELASKHNRGWHYYSADYYYKSESAIGAITDRVKGMAEDRGFREFEIPDYKAIGKNSLYNFNSAVSGESDYIPGGLRAVEEKWILDFDAVPPEDFKWFFEEEGSSEDVFMSGDGEDLPRPKSRVWAMYKDMLASNSFDFSLGRDLPSDVKNLGDLLQFGAGLKSEIAVVNKYLRNFQAAPSGYFAAKAWSESQRRAEGGWNAKA